ncbi:sigma-54 interaction domain-containing protein [Halomonas sp. C05BenzN]|uniref:sigma-54 interaction domain-containing protein n=1 Tax=Halomonas sp. C05BenzN TaxID=3411041 RepID=UPI003B92F55F
MPDEGAGAPPSLKAENEYCMVGDSVTIRRLYRDIGKIASVDAPVLITGESGTGKELTARAIHEHSPRRSGPFNAVNCGALPSGIIQSELFGHEKGAFTGATQRKIGIIESSSSGTLFLDEIGDLPLDLQVNLLRFLENHRVLRVGGLKEIPVDVRVLAATHVDLEKATREDGFREDLFHRLNVLQINTPPLRERPEDIEPLANFFFRKFTDEKAACVRGFSRESLIRMRQYAWPGNIRELINRVRRAMVMCDKRLITPVDLGLERRQHATRHRMTLEQARDMAECDAIKAALARNKGKMIHAARELGISRVTLYRLIDKHGIDRCSGSAEGDVDLHSSNIIRLPSG